MRWTPEAASHTTTLGRTRSAGSTAEAVRVHWSTVALERVVEAAQFVGRDDPAAGERLVDGLFAAVERLADLPHSGRIVPELRREDTREVFHARYRIIYRVKAERVEILTIRHMRQSFGPEDVEG